MSILYIGSSPYELTFTCLTFYILYTIPIYHILHFYIEIQIPMSPILT